MSTYKETKKKTNNKEKQRERVYRSTPNKKKSVSIAFGSLYQLTFVVKLALAKWLTI